MNIEKRLSSEAARDARTQESKNEQEQMGSGTKKYMSS
jgi:hypothetical protein